MEAVEQLNNIKLEFEFPIDETNYLVLDVSELNVAELASGSDDNTEGYLWVGLLCDSSQVNIERGMDLNQDVFARSEATTLSVVMHGDSTDPVETLGLGPNSRIRVKALVDDAWEMLFTGKVRTILASYGEEREATTTIVAHDIIRELNNIQGVDTGSRYFYQRMWTLDDYVGISSTTQPFPGGVLRLLAPVKTSRSVWEQMNIAANSVAGMVFTTRNGGLVGRDRNYEAEDHVIEFSDIHDDEDPLHSCYTDIDVVYDTTNLTNSLKITNISTDVDGVDVEEDLGTYTDTTSVSTYGEYPSSILTNLADVAHIDELVTHIFTYYATPYKRVNTITYSPEQYWQSLIEVGDQVGVELHKVDGTTLIINDSYMVCSVKHTITPGSWEITLGLFKAWTGATGVGGTFPVEWNRTKPST